MECCGYFVPEWVVDFLDEKDFSVYAAHTVCRVWRVVKCDNALELVSALIDMTQDRLPLRNCDQRIWAEIAEKLGVTP